MKKLGRPRKHVGGTVVVTVTMGLGTFTEFERRRKSLSRGDFIRWLLEQTRGLEPE